MSPLQPAKAFASDPDFLVKAYSALTFATVAVFGIIHLLSDQNKLLGQLELIGAAAVLLNLLALRLIQNSWLVRNNLTFIILGILIVMLLTGGLSHTGIYWFFIFPIAAVFLTGRRTGIIWTCVLLFCIASATLLEAFAIVAIPYTFIELQQMSLCLIVTAIGIYFYQQARDSLEVQTKTSAQNFQAEKIKSDLIVENIDEGVVATANDGTVLFMNKAAQQMLRWPLHEAIGRKFTEIVPMTDRSGKPVPSLNRPIPQVLRKRSFLKMTVNYIRKDGTPFPAAIAARAIVIDGKIRGAIGTIRDITEEQAIDKAKSEFATIASHQLRTPISAISWISELLLHGDIGKLNPEQLDYVQQIYHSNERMALLVDSLLMTSSLELGSLPVHIEPIDLIKLSHTVLKKELTKHPHAKKLKIIENYDPLPPINLDENITKAILYRLLSNSLKYTPSGSITITIAKSKKKLNPKSAGSILIEITDTGVGIPLYQQEKVFSKLFRAENITPRDTDGTGLGLYVVKAAMAYVGGTVTFHSAEDKGSTFSLLVPIEGMTKPPTAHNQPKKDSQ